MHLRKDSKAGLMCLVCTRTEVERATQRWRQRKRSLRGVCERLSHSHTLLDFAQGALAESSPNDLNAERPGSWQNS